MRPILKSRRSSEFDAFRCIGADCEDTCCVDWGVSIDRNTYEKYQVCSDPHMQPLLHQLVTINPTKGNDEDFARIALIENRCPFLAEGLCSIQQKLGESYLSNTCSSYPRLVVIVDGTAEKSLHLSCPEAARLVLQRQGPHEWNEQTIDAEEVSGHNDGKVREESILRIDSLQANRGGTPYPYFHEVRKLFLQVLQPDVSPRWQRLAIVALLAEELNTIIEGRHSSGKQESSTAEFILRSRTALQSGAFQIRRVAEEHPLIQLEAVLEMIVARISSDFTAHRFLECYREFMQGLCWDAESTMEELSCRYRDAEIRHYAPFMRRHEYLLDNFLIDYVVRTVFPYGHRETGQKMQIEYVENAIRRQYLMLAAHYAALRTVLIGMAAFNGNAFGTTHVIKLVQSYSKAFMHSNSYSGKALQVLSSHGITLPPQAVSLFQDSEVASHASDGSDHVQVFED
jgi:lysine-N-methylase